MAYLKPFISSTQIGPECTGVIPTAETLLTGTSLGSSATVYDLDGCSFHLSLEETQDKGMATSSQCSEDASSLRILFRHVIPVKDLDGFGNMEVHLSSSENTDAEASLLPLEWHLCWQKDASIRLRDPFAAAELVLQPDLLARPETRQRLLHAVSKLRILTVLPLFSHAAALFLASRDPAASAGDFARSEEPAQLFAPISLLYHPSQNEHIVLYVHEHQFKASVSMHAAAGEAALLTEHALRAYHDVRRTGAAGMAGAPAFTYARGPAPPPGLSENLSEAPPTNKGDADDVVFWCSFQLYPHHLRTAAARCATLTALMNFRGHIHRHLYATQAAMRRELRQRVDRYLSETGIAGNVARSGDALAALCPRWETL